MNTPTDSGMFTRAEMLERYRNGHNFTMARIREGLDTADAELFLSSVDNQSAMFLVQLYAAQLNDVGILEHAFRLAHTGTRVNNIHTDPVAVGVLFHTMDRDKLRECGDPLPDGDPLTIYRGVSGDSPADYAGGISWTTDLGCACWFALRYPELKNPTVYVADVGRGDVAWFDNGRQESEVVLWPGGEAMPIDTADLTPVDMRALAADYRQRTGNHLPSQVRAPRRSSLVNH